MSNQHTEVADFQRLPTNPKVSIIVLAYRHEAFLEQAVDSLARQRADFPYEIVIGEDASPDRTRDVALALQRKYPQLVRVLYSKSNRGMIANFRFTLSFCRGEYLAGCEGDDFWIDDWKLARQVAALDRCIDVDMAFTRGDALFPDGTRVEGCDYGPVDRIVPAKELFAGLGWVAPPASIMMRGHILRDLPLWMDQAPVGDIFHMLAGSARGGAYYEPISTICYRMAQPTSFTVTHGQRSGADRIQYYEALIRSIERTCTHYNLSMDVMADRLNDFRLQLLKAYLSERNIPAAIGNFLKLDRTFLISGLKRRISRVVLLRHWGRGLPRDHFRNHFG